MPLFEYRCNHCGAVTEVLVRPPASEAAVSCGRCASGDVVRMVSRFIVRASRETKYDDSIRERALPYLKSRPGGEEMLAEAGGSEEAATYELTERIGQRVDQALEQNVFRNL